MAEILVHRFSNGLVLLGEQLPWLESAAFALSVPAGAQHDPADRLGLANLLCEQVQRGAGDRDSRRFIEDLERLGVEGSGSASNAHISFGGAMPAESLIEALGIYADVLRRPHLPEDQFDDAVKVCLQELASLEDDLAQRTLLELKRIHFPAPYGRSVLGTAESLEAMTPADVERQFRARFHPQGTILSVAGRFDPERLIDSVGQLLGDWQVPAAPEPIALPPEHGIRHLSHESSQTHLAIAYPSVAYRDPEYFLARGAVGVLSDGLSSRLFREVREVRGLCYTVYASLHSLRDRGAVVTYAGTSAERAQETLDVTLRLLRELRDGIDEQELARLKVQIRSNLVMQQESSRSRASAIAGDWYHLGQVRTLERIRELIEGLTVEAIGDFLADHPPQEFDVVTLGPNPLEILP